MLENLGLKVFTNPTGSNFTRGVVSALLDRVTLGGRLDADIAVLELDEAYAVHFVRQVKPRHCLLLNVMRDQLDRFGEIDNTARLLSSVAEATTEAYAVHFVRQVKPRHCLLLNVMRDQLDRFGEIDNTARLLSSVAEATTGTVVLNREDPRIAALADVAPATASVRYFGLDASLRSFRRGARHGLGPLLRTGCLVALVLPLRRRHGHHGEPAGTRSRRRAHGVRPSIRCRIRRLGRR